MLQPKVLDRLQQNELFNFVQRDLLQAVFDGEEAQLADFRRGDLIFSKELYRSAIGLILRGSAQVLKNVNGIMVTRLQENDVFGGSVLFTGGAFYTDEVIATRDTRVLFLSKNAIVKLMQLDSGFAVSFIRYLSQHIYFLNRRIDNFTGGSAESRLANYLLGCFEDYKTYELDRSMHQLAVSLDISRASLYRAFERLIDGGAIQRDGKNIRLVEKTALLSFIS